MVLVLGAITLVAGAAVGGVYLLTKEAIDQVQDAKIDAAIAAVLPKYQNSPAKEVIFREVEGDTVRIYPGRDGAGELVGYAIETFSKNGFGGRIDLMVGLRADGAIERVAVVGHNETPGLGDKIEPDKSDFALQFEGKNPATFRLQVKQDGGDVDAITASTITSKAFSDAVQRAYDLFKTLTPATEQKTGIEPQTTGNESDSTINNLLTYGSVTEFYQGAGQREPRFCTPAGDVPHAGHHHFGHQRLGYGSRHAVRLGALEHRHFAR